MRLQRNGRVFSIDETEPYSRWWFQERFPAWEVETFFVLERFLTPGAIYLDLGAWIGPTVLYAAALGAKIHALEPDPVALQRLRRNLRANPEFTQVKLHALALAERRSRLRFGGNGALGNSESSLLVNDADFLEHGGLELHWRGDDPHWRQGEQVEVQAVTLAEFLTELALDPAELALIKMDIEGSEKWVVPTLAQALGTARPPLYLSLHRTFLQEADLRHCLQILNELYGGMYRSDFAPLTVAEALASRQEDLLFLAQ